MSYKILKITVVKNLPFGGSPVVYAIYPDAVTNSIEQYRDALKAEYGADKVFMAYEEIKSIKTN